jgi:hypothetical protein
MEFGQCKVCRKYKFLIHQNACKEHAEIPNLNVKTGVMTDYSNPSSMCSFCSTVVDDPRINQEKGGDTVKLVLSDMEIIVKDESGDPIEKFEYGNEKEISDKTEMAIDWIISRYG